MVDGNITEVGFSTPQIVHLDKAVIQWQLKVTLQTMMSTLTQMKSLIQQQINNDMECKTIHLVEVRVSGKQYLDSMINHYIR